MSQSERDHFFTSPERLLIGFGHKRRRGKDAAGIGAAADIKMLEDKWYRHGDGMRRDVIQTGFAAALKEGIGREVLGLSTEQLYGDRKKAEYDDFWGASPRQLLQLMGTDVMREHFRHDVWVKALERKVGPGGIYEHQHVLICDVRFPNEAEMIQRLGGKVICIHRDVAASDEDQHLSETALEGWAGWDTVIDNNGSLAALENAVSVALRQLCRSFYSV